VAVAHRSAKLAMKTQLSPAPWWGLCEEGSQRSLQLGESPCRWVTHCHYSFQPFAEMEANLLKEVTSPRSFR
jgi:hypothetical protein